MVDFLFLSGEECGEADCEFSGFHFGEAECGAAASRVGHSECSFLGAQVIDRAAEVAIPVNTIEGEVEVAIEQQHGKSPICSFLSVGSE